jgi:hypothetical protein
VDHDDIGARIVAAVGEDGARELLDVLTRPEADRAALIGRIHQRQDAAWLAELLIDLGEDEPARLRLLASLQGDGDRECSAERLPSYGPNG